MFIFYKKEDGKLHYSLVSKTLRLSGAIPIGEQLLGGTMIAKPEGLVIKAGEAFVVFSEPGTGASLAPDYEAGNVAFGVFAK